MDKKNLLTIITFSFLIGLIFNYLNPKGISFIRQERILEYAKDDIDSLNQETLSPISTNLNSNNNKSSDSSNQLKDINEKELKEQNLGFTKPIAIKIDKAYKLFKQGVKFIDARMPEEYNEGHIKGAINIPFDGDESYREVLKTINKDEVLVTYCSGTECDLSILLGDELFEKGYKKVYIFFGGWNDWIDKGYPISKGLE